MLEEQNSKLALKIVDKLIEQFPDTVSLLIIKSIIELELQKTKKAHKTLKKGLKKKEITQEQQETIHSLLAQPDDSMSTYQTIRQTVLTPVMPVTNTSTSSNAGPNKSEEAESTVTEASQSTVSVQQPEHKEPEPKPELAKSATQQTGLCPNCNRRVFYKLDTCPNCQTKIR